MASIAVVLIILGCAAYQYFKGTFIKAFATIIIAICASVAAFGFFEVLANVFISKGADSRFLSLVPWAQTLCFALLFIVVFGALQTGVMFLTRWPIDLGFLPERIGRVACGIFLGLLLSGFLLTALGMAPLPNKYPYQRFDGRRSKVLLNADGLATGLFSIISNGSLSGTRSFATIHPDFLDQVHLNRQISGTSTLTSRAPAISLPRQAVWPAPESLREQVDQIVSQLNRQGKLKDELTGKLISMPGPGSDYQPTIVRLGIKSSSLRPQATINGGVFILPQLRLICKRKGYGDDPQAGTGINIYPIGHLKSADEIQVSTEIKIDSRNDFKGGAREKFIDFVFCIPRDFVPVLFEFKQNSIVEIPSSAIVTADQAPPPEFFTQTSKSDSSSGTSRNSSPSSSPPREQRTRSGSGQRRPGDSRRSIIDDDE
jgi:hypothetical protein